MKGCMGEWTQSVSQSNNKPVYQSVYFFVVCLSICLFVSLFKLPVITFAHMSSFLLVCLSVRPSVRLSPCLHRFDHFACVPVCLSVSLCVSVCLSTEQFNIFDLIPISIHPALRSASYFQRVTQKETVPPICHKRFFRR